ncbi:MAG: M56 family metallopeptidase [Lachnospiraceae bacterium]|nr:M56 family metallopeptidase [Lachnospiraceae bacterium]
MTEWILTSSVLILLVLAVRGLFKNKMKAKSVYALWLLVLVRLLCPVNFGELSFNLLSLAEEGKAQVEERLELKQEVTAPEETGYFWSENGRVVYPPVTDAVTNAQPNKLPAESMPEVKTGSPAVTKEPLAFPFPEFSWEQVLPVVWLAGMIGMAVVIFGVNISFGTTLGMFRKELPAMERKGRGKQKLSVYLADGISSSCLYGMVRPSIYLNRTGMGEQEKTYCVEHEYSHYLQGDMVWSLCRTVCLILHWYNPLVWVAVTLSKKDAELACDERTIERLGEEERYNYGHTLVELAAAQSRAVQMFGMATLMASDKKEVVERVKAITMKKETKIITGLLVAILVVGIGFFVFTGEAKGDQENNNNGTTVATVTKTPAKNTQQKATTLTPTPMPTWIADKYTLTTDEKSSDWAENVRIYKEKDINSAYAERYLGYDRLRAVRDVGDERWFMVETMDGESGWVLYGEHKGVDIRIRSLLDASEESYAENRTKKALETELAFKEEITYQPLSFTDHIALDYKPGEGWSIDLNGDGKEELLYITGNRIFINETMQLSYKPERNLFFWLLDIDTTDGMYELLDENGNMFIFNGSYLCGVKGIQEHWFTVEETEKELKFLQYCGSLNNFTRLDEHTISFEDCFFMETSFFANAHYRLDENHGLQLIPQEYEVRLYNPTKGVNWYNYSKNKDKCFRVYKDRDLTGEFAEAANLTGAKLTKSDCVEWAYIEIENGLSGWLYFGEGK